MSDMANNDLWKCSKALDKYVTGPVNRTSELTVLTIQGNHEISFVEDGGSQ